MKKFLVKIRSSVKLLILICIATLLIFATVVFVYKPIYSVTLNGQLIGYSRDKSKLQKQINDYIEKGDGDNKNLAFVAIDEMPKYKMCLLKRGITTNDEEIFEKVAETGTEYYKYFAILEGNEEKVYVSDFTTAEKVIKSLKKKRSSNIDDITIKEKYETEMKDITSYKKAVAKLYERKAITRKSALNVAKASYTSTGGKVSTSLNISRSKPTLGISLIKPVTGRISSRFGVSSRLRRSYHTGLDIACSKGTAIKVAASGTVTFAGWKGSYGNLVVVTHSNGVQTYYGHCSRIFVSAGQQVSQGSVIAAVGSTGNSTGPHLHLEVRVNGVAYNPQNYVY